jgi:hypothetical protein
MYPQEIVITPQLASEWLKFNTSNRKLPQGNAKYYQRLIESGQFFTTHQGLAFTGSPESPKRLIDGQTRLTAIIKSGIAISQWVFWECDERCFEAIDGGKPRSFVDHHGWSKDKTALCNFLFGLASSNRVKITKKEADAIWLSFGPQFSELVANCPTSRRGITPTAVKAGCCIAMHQNPQKASEISDQYRFLALAAVEKMVPSVGRLMIKLMSIEGGGGSAQMTQFAFTHKAMTPPNWGLTKLYGPDDSYAKSIAIYIKAAANL